MPGRKNLTGMKFGKWTVICKSDNRGVKTAYKCICDCGNERDVITSSLSLGKSTSCGCEQIKAVTKHGLENTPTYISWKSMKQRCSGSHKFSKYYSSRGIKVCDRWMNSFENFLEDMGERPEGKTLDRINNDGIYEPSNCRWATYKEQANNRRKQGGLNVAGIN